MNLSKTNEQIAAGSVATGSAKTRLTGPWLVIARAVWLALVVPGLFLFVIGLPVYDALLHLEPGGTLVMPFMLLWTGPAPTSVEWRPNGEALRPEDGAIVRRWSRSTFDLVNQLEHTEDRYEVTRGGEVVASEVQARSPATRWYTDEQAIALYQAAGLADIRVVRGFTDEPATSSDKIFSVFGTRPRGATDQLAV